MDMADEYPDVVIGCVGGGSNFSGLAFPFIRENLKGNKSTRMFGSGNQRQTPTLTKGIYTF